jgi:hypothetical protein
VNSNYVLLSFWGEFPKDLLPNSTRFCQESGLYMDLSTGFLNPSAAYFGACNTPNSNQHNRRLQIDSGMIS